MSGHESLTVRSAWSLQIRDSTGKTMPSVRVQFSVHDQTFLRSVRDVILTLRRCAVIDVFLRAKCAQNLRGLAASATHRQ